MIVVPGLVQRAEQLHDLPGLRGVQVAGRFVGQDHLRVGDDGARDADELLLAARQLIRDRDPSCRRSESDRARRRPAPGVPCGRRCGRTAGSRGSRRRSGCRAGGSSERRSRCGACAARRAAWASADGPADRGSSTRRTRRIVHAEDVEQGRLAGARRPHDRHELARLDVQRRCAAARRSAPPPCGYAFSRFRSAISGAADPPGVDLLRRHGAVASSSGGSATTRPSKR